MVCFLKNRHDPCIRLKFVLQISERDQKSRISDIHNTNRANENVTKNPWIFWDIEELRFLAMELYFVFLLCKIVKNKETKKSSRFRYLRTKHSPKCQKAKLSEHAKNPVGFLSTRKAYVLL